MTMKCSLSRYKSLHVCIYETMLHNNDNDFKTASERNTLTHGKAKEIQQFGSKNAKYLLSQFFQDEERRILQKMVMGIQNKYSGGV